MKEFRNFYLLGHKNKKLLKLDQPAPVIIKLLHHLLHLREEQYAFYFIEPLVGQTLCKEPDQLSSRNIFLIFAPALLVLHPSEGVSSTYPC